MHFGAKLGYVGPMLGLCWAMLGLCWGYVGAMLGLCWGYVGAMLGILKQLQNMKAYFPKKIILPSVFTAKNDLNITWFDIRNGKREFNLGAVVYIHIYI